MPVWIIDVVVIGIAGFFGKKALEIAGGLTLIFTLAVTIGSHSSVLWGIVAWVIALFIGYVITNVRDILNESKQEKK